jgi:hypothetical protein
MGHMRFLQGGRWRVCPSPHLSPLLEGEEVEEKEKIDSLLHGGGDRKIRCGLGLRASGRAEKRGVLSANRVGIDNRGCFPFAVRSRRILAASRTAVSVFSDSLLRGDDELANLPTLIPRGVLGASGGVYRSITSTLTLSSYLVNFYLPAPGQRGNGLTGRRRR